ncbi:OHCU-decarbox domain-containing protein [Mycena chlorophos]|uniref:OHCU-decarbox domain-containing protein n=1 Tax=Mycena chlorophos TaxID=658473 RepID=A0A8H6VRP8_MYCCL|nr:OHCU-decarbox domain-containing protein [Mycena chlorophos]
MSLPPTITAANLPDTLALLLEPSSTLPHLVHGLEGQTFESYDELIDAAIAQVSTWQVHEQALFIEGHPRIGAVQGLSRLSNKEQGGDAIDPTPADVLLRLAHLNACYEHSYPGLRYITFVNGRSRQEVLVEMEEMLHIPHSLAGGEPGVNTLVPVEKGSQAWRAELDRAVQDVGRIAKSRVRALS